MAESKDSITIIHRHRRSDVESERRFHSHRWSVNFGFATKEQSSRLDMGAVNSFVESYNNAFLCDTGDAATLRVHGDGMFLIAEMDSTNEHGFAAHMLEGVNKMLKLFVTEESTVEAISVAIFENGKVISSLNRSASRDTKEKATITPDGHKNSNTVGGIS